MFLACEKDYKPFLRLVKTPKYAFPKESKKALLFWQMPDVEKWLDGRLGQRGINDAELARRAGVNQSVISKMRGGMRPSLDTCVAIARALGVSAVEVLVETGGIPKPSDYSPEREEWNTLFDSLEPDDRSRILVMGRTLKQETEREGEKRSRVH